MRKYNFLDTCSMCRFSNTCKYKSEMEKLAKILSNIFDPNYKPIEYLPISKFSLLCDYWQFINEEES